MPRKYTEENMISLSGLDHIRQISKGSLGESGNGLDGHVRLIREVTDNSIDELISIGSGKLSVMYYRDTKRKTFQFVIIDNGAGIPIGKDKFKKAFTQPGTSAKFINRKDVSLYGRTSGQQGVGLKATCALASKIRAVSFRHDGVGELLVTKAHIDNYSAKKGKKVVKEYGGSVIGPTGLMVMYEPDKTIMEDTEECLKDNSIFDAIHMLMFKICLFQNIDISMYVSKKPLDKEMWTNPIPLVNAELYAQIQSGELKKVFDSTSDVSTDDAFEKLFSMTHPIWATDVKKSSDRLDFDIRLAVSSSTGAYSMQKYGLILVNMVEMKSSGCSPFIALQRVLKKQLAPFIENADERAWMMKHYDVPVYFLMSVSYEEAEFAGASKHSFVSKKFVKEFEALWTKTVKEMEKESESDTTWANLFNALQDDISSRYERYYAKPVTKKKSVLFSLNHPDNFYGCDKNASDKELVMIEGMSADGLKDERDMFNQCVYVLRGKLFNTLKSLTSSSKTSLLKVLNKNAIVQDIMTLLKVGPSDTNLDKCEYSRIIICQDADADGFHIAALVITALYLINPLLISEGRVCVSTPPLYSIKLKSSRKDDRYFIRDYKSLIYYRAFYLYQELLDIKVQTPVKEYKLKNEVFGEFVMMIIEVCKNIEMVSENFDTDPHVFELLLRCSYYLTDGYLSQDVSPLEEVFGKGAVEYNKESKTLCVICDNDHYIPIVGLQSAIYNEILPQLKKFKWDKCSFFVKTKEQKQYKPASLYHFYEIFRTIDKQFKIERFKGLGQMKSEESARMCIDRKTRSAYMIDSIGSVKDIYGAMGHDVTYRNKMLMEMITYDV